jgi:hypothetical protein
LFFQKYDIIVTRQQKDVSNNLRKRFGPEQVKGETMKKRKLEKSGLEVSALARLEENIGAVAIDLTADDLREIDSAASKITMRRRLPSHD